MIAENQSSAILYAVVARQDVPLAEHSPLSGNFAQVTRTILKALPAENKTTSYRYGEYWVRYCARDGIVFLCIAGSLAAADTCFRFLDAIRARFVEQIGGAWKHALELELNAQFGVCLRTQMDHFNSPDLCTVSNVREHIAEIKGYAEESIEKILTRQEKIDILVDKAQLLTQTSFVWRRETTSLRQHMCRRAWKHMVCMVVAIIAAVLVAWFWACGPSFCFSHADPHPTPSNGTLFFENAPAQLHRLVESVLPRTNTTIV
jgi:vesicle-associated membrane protein 7